MMFESISRSWELVKASWYVLRSDKELVVFPVVSGLGVLVVSILFFVPSLAAGLFDSLAAPRGAENMRILSAVVGFLFYVVMYTVIFYFNAALVGAAVIRLQGGDPTLRDGIRIASQRMGSIVGYAIISATVGMVLRALSRRAGVVGQIVISLVGLAWNIATFLVVPVLVVENVGPIEAIKRSTSVLKKTWGEQLVGNLGMGAAFGMIWLAVIAGGIVLIVIASALKSTALVILAVILMIVAILALAVISSTLNGIYRAALYCYAEHKDTNGLFDVSLLEQAFKQK